MLEENISVYKFHDDISDVSVWALDMYESTNDLSYFAINRREKEADLFPYAYAKNIYRLIQSQIGAVSEGSPKAKQFYSILREWIIKSCDFVIKKNRRLLTDIWTLEKRMDQIELKSNSSKSMSYSNELAKMSTYFKFPIRAKETSIYDFLQYRTEYKEAIKRINAEARRKNKK